MRDVVFFRMSLRYENVGGWGFQSNWEFDFGCGCVRACVRSCVQAREGRVSFRGRARKMDILGVPGMGRPAERGQTFQDLIASRDPAQCAMRFHRLHCPNNSQNLLRVCRPRGPDPPAPIGLACSFVLRGAQRCLRGALDVP